MERIPGYSGKWLSGRRKDRNAVLRTFERDKDELRSLGVPIETVPAPARFGAEDEAGYRRTTRDLYMPYLRLLAGSAGGDGDVDGTGAGSGSEDGAATRKGRTSETASGPRRWSTGAPRVDHGAVEIHEDEAAAALQGLAHVAALPGFPLAPEARSAFRKLAFDLDPARLVETSVLFLPPPGRGASGPTMEALVDGLIRRKRVAFRYHGIRRAETTDRSLEPYGLFVRFGRWYLAGREVARADVRVFRADRMEDVGVNPREPNTPDFEVPGDFDLAALAGRRPWELDRGEARPVEVRLRFPFPASRLAARNRLGEAVGECADGSQVRSLTVGDTESLVRWVLGLGGDAEIVSPDRLVRELRSSAGKVADLHAPAAGPLRENDLG